MAGPLTDFGQPWFAAKALLAGIDPYPLVGPGRTFPHEFSLVYPLTAGLIVLPLGALPQVYATSVFIAVSSGLLAFAVTKDGWWRLPLFLSTAFFVAVRQGQWSPMLAAAFLLPGLAWVAAAKPTIGAALLLANGSAKTTAVGILGSLFLAALALAIVPDWPTQWLSAVTSVQHMSVPVWRPLGVLLLLTLLRWRRPEARLILALGCVPQTLGWYEVLPLLLVPCSFRQSLSLALLSSLPVAGEAVFGRSDGLLDFSPTANEMIVFAYLPATIMVLRRPNEGELPVWLRGPLSVSSRTRRAMFEKITGRRKPRKLRE